MGKSNAKGDSYYGRVAQNYEKRRRKQDWWNVEQDQMMALLETLPKGLSVIDIPFGTGRFVPYYLQRGFDVHGIDASVEMLKAASESLGDDFRHCRVGTGNAMDLDLQDGQFDLLVSTRFLRDIVVARDAMKALREFARVCSRYAIIQLGENTSGRSVPVDPERVLESRLSADGNAQMLAEAGLRITDKRRVKSDPDQNSEIFHYLCEKL